MIYALYYFIVLMLFALVKSGRIEVKRVMFISAFLLILIVALRSPSMGVDLGGIGRGGYIDAYYHIGEMSWSSIFSSREYLNYEFGYILYSKLLYCIYPNHQFLLIITAVLSICPFWILFSKYSKNYFFSILVYLSMPLFLLSYSGLRQSIAIGLCCIAALSLCEKKIIKFLIWVLLASLFHSSALFFVLACPLYYIKMKQKTRLLLLVLLPIPYLNKTKLFVALCNLFGYSYQITETGAFMFLIFLVLLYVFVTLYEVEADGGWKNLLFVACILQTMSGINSVVMRVGYYYLLSLPIVVPNAISGIKKGTDRHLVSIALGLFFLFYGLYSIINSGWAEAYPYSFFWEVV